jgi:TDG/mug DNA glycosylase family protein
MPLNSIPWKPTQEQLTEAYGKSVHDIIDYNLDVLFCGINPSLYTAAVGHHFARPGNRFWPVIFKSGFTQRLYSPFEEDLLLENKIGITNVVNRATATAAELTSEDYISGESKLRSKINNYKPGVLAVLGVGAYKQAFKVKNVSVGKQECTIDSTTLWVLPNPSGLNANYQLDDLVRLFSELKRFLDTSR